MPHNRVIIIIVSLNENTSIMIRIIMYTPLTLSVGVSLGDSDTLCNLFTSRMNTKYRQVFEIDTTSAGNDSKAAFETESMKEKVGTGSGFTLKERAKYWIHSLQSHLNPRQTKQHRRDVQQIHVT